MKQQVIQNFLNLPGIVGLGLMDGHSRPYFCGIDKSLNFQQKEALTQGIQQVISTTPASFEAFDFRFSQRDARIYKLENGVILLVVTDEDLDTPTYQTAVAQLKQTLETDPHSAVSTFRLLAGSTTLTKVPSDADVSSDPAATSALPSKDPPPPAQTGTPARQWPEVIAALDALSDATAQYLGKIVVANTWRSTQPSSETLQALQLDRSGHFNWSTDATTKESGLVSSEEQEALHIWVDKFTQRCAMIIRDYPEMVLRQALNDHQRALLQISIP